MLFTQGPELSSNAVECCMEREQNKEKEEEVFEKRRRKKRNFRRGETSA